MKVLFSPSEMKSEVSGERTLDMRNFSFADVRGVRENVVKGYAKFIANADDIALAKLFGVKNISDDLRENIFAKGCIKAVRRYTGVAYTALMYASLNDGVQEFVDENVIIFSNLFGPILARDLLPNYKLKQGEKFDLLDLAKIYRENFSNAIDRALKNECVVDLRAGFYEKFYEIKVPFLSFKFLKNGKIVSHYAKAYRGKILRQIAQNKAQSESEILNINFGDVKLKEIRQIGLKKEILLEILCE